MGVLLLGIDPPLLTARHGYLWTVLSRKICWKWGWISNPMVQCQPAGQTLDSGVRAPRLASSVPPPVKQKLSPLAPTRQWKLLLVTRLRIGQQMPWQTTRSVSLLPQAGRWTMAAVTWW